MEAFSYGRAEAPAAALASAHAPDAHYIAGGTNLIDYMRLDVVRPGHLVDINPLERGAHGQITVTGEELKLGALVRMADAQAHPVVQRDFPVVANSLALAASQQIRNMASLGGNILQRTRCEYFREVSWPCNKRQPGAGCSALDGVNREHAVLGGSEACVATYPGDFAQALMALDAVVETLDEDGGRLLPIAELHRPPTETAHIETVLRPGELIAFIHIPNGPHTRRSQFVKVRDRQSYQFAVASAAVALALDGDRVADARIALGGVATVPWRARNAERRLIGGVLDERTAELAAELAFEGARPLQHNRHKIEAGRAAIVEALLRALAMEA